MYFVPFTLDNMKCSMSARGLTREMFIILYRYIVYTHSLYLPEGKAGLKDAKNDLQSYVTVSSAKCV